MNEEINSSIPSSESSEPQAGDTSDELRAAYDRQIAAQKAEIAALTESKTRWEQHAIEHEIKVAAMEQKAFWADQVVTVLSRDAQICDDRVVVPIDGQQMTPAEAVNWLKNNPKTSNYFLDREQLLKQVSATKQNVDLKELVKSPEAIRKAIKENPEVLGLRRRRRPGS